jgi:hypothetical protein
MLSSSIVLSSPINNTLTKIEDKTYARHTQTSTVTTPVTKPVEASYSKTRDVRTKPTETFEERYTKFQQEHKKKFGEDTQESNVLRVRTQFFHFFNISKY